MKLTESLIGGVAGATVLTLIHETARRVNPDAPRMDLLGMRAIAKLMQGAGETPPGDSQLHNLAMAGDLISNSLYYSLIGAGKKDSVWLRGALLGLGAGVGGVVLPGPLGLGEKPSARTPQTQAMTVAWYLAGGLTAAAVSFLLAKTRKK
jgi:hypothetical protein